MDFDKILGNFVNTVIYKKHDCHCYINFEKNIKDIYICFKYYIINIIGICFITVNQISRNSILTRNKFIKFSYDMFNMKEPYCIEYTSDQIRLIPLKIEFGKTLNWTIPFQCDIFTYSIN